MGTQSVERSHISGVGRALGAAFFDDPVMTWMLPDPTRRARGLPRMFATMTRHHFLAGGASELVAGGPGPEPTAAALWDPPNRWQQTQLEELRMLPAFLRAFGTRMGRGQQVSDLMKTHHPEEPHWYLSVIGSHPDHRGAGQGWALMQSGLDRADAEHAPAYLESTKAENVPYYQRFGFDVTREITIPDGGPTLWAMWRGAR